MVFDIVFLLSFLGFLYILGWLWVVRLVLCDDVVVDPPMEFGPWPKDHYEQDPV